MVNILDGRKISEGVIIDIGDRRTSVSIEVVDHAIGIGVLVEVQHRARDTRLPFLARRIAGIIFGSRDGIEHHPRDTTVSTRRIDTLSPEEAVGLPHEGLEALGQYLPCLGAISEISVLGLRLHIHDRIRPLAQPGVEHRIGVRGAPGIN